MAVVLSDGQYSVSRRPFPPPQDSHGTPAPAALGAAGPSRPGGARELSLGTYSLRLDPAEWPIHPGDLITGPGGRQYTVIDNPRLHTNSAVSDLDYVSVTAALYEGPLVQPYTP